MRSRHLYRVRDTESLRRRMAESQRIVPHSVRSLAEEVEVNRSTIGHLLTGEQKQVTQGVARRIAVALGSHVDDLFVPIASEFENKDKATGVDR